MLDKLIHSGFGAVLVLKEKIEDEVKILEKKGKIKKGDAKTFMKALEKKGKKEDIRVKKQMKSLLKELINELGLATKKDLKKMMKKLNK